MKRNRQKGAQRQLRQVHDASIVLTVVYQKAPVGAEVTSNSEKIKLVALAIIELQGISQSVSRKFHCIENLENFAATYCKYFKSRF